MIASLAMLVLASAQTPAPAPAVLRHAVYTAHVDVRDATAAKVHGPSAQEYQAPSMDTVDHVVSDVTLTVDVLAALDDRTLVMQISETGKDRNAAAQRVGVSSTGDILQPPNAPALFAEESELLSLMARDLVTGRDVSKGVSWNAALPSKMSGMRTFRVTDATASLAHFDYDEEIASTDAAGLTIHQTGSFDYDIAHSLPIAGSLDGDIKTKTSFVESDEHIVENFKLQSDSLSNS